MEVHFHQSGRSCHDTSTRGCAVQKSPHKVSKIVTHLHVHATIARRRGRKSTSAPRSEMLIKRGKANCNNSSIQQKRKPSLSCTMMLPMLSSSSSSPRHRGSPRGDRSSASRSKMNSDSTIVMLSSSDNNERRGTRSSSSSLFTPTQACALAALCSSMAAAVTALMAFCFFSSGSSLSSSGYDFYSDHMVASTTRSIISRRRVRSLTSDANSNKNGALQEMAINNVTSGKPESLGALKAVVSEKLKLPPPQISRFPLSTLPEPVDDLSSPRPHIAWLMSFPNRYVCTASVTVLIECSRICGQFS